MWVDVKLGFIFGETKFEIRYSGCPGCLNSQCATSPDKFESMWIDAYFEFVFDEIRFGKGSVLVVLDIWIWNV